jgi:hypothetical protein
MWMKSMTANDDPNRVSPKIDIEEPLRANDLSDKDAPKCR